MRHAGKCGHHGHHPRSSRQSRIHTDDGGTSFSLNRSSAISRFIVGRFLFSRRDGRRGGSNNNGTMEGRKAKPHPFFHPLLLCSFLDPTEVCLPPSLHLPCGSTPSSAISLSAFDSPQEGTWLVLGEPRHSRKVNDIVVNRHWCP